MRTRLLLVFLVIALCVVGLHFLSRSHRERCEELTSAFLREEQGCVQRKAREVEDLLQDLYRSARTVSLLPNVRELKGANRSKGAKGHYDPARLAADPAMCVQQIYNNTVASMGASEIYCVLDGFCPDRGEIPFFSFDALILRPKHEMASDAAAADLPEEDEDEEYDYLVKALHEFATHHPHFTFASLDSIPCNVSPPMRTCDNTQYTSKSAGDPVNTRGLVFTVPMYSEAGAFAGVISLIIRLNVFEALLVGVPSLLITDQDRRRAAQAGWSMPGPPARFVLRVPERGVAVFDRRNTTLGADMDSMARGAHPQFVMREKLQAPTQVPWILEYLADNADLAAKLDQERTSFGKDAGSMTLLALLCLGILLQDLRSALIRRDHESMRRTLRTTELQFQTVVDAALDAIVVADARGTILSWNPAAERMFGYSAEEACGRSIGMLTPERDRAAHPQVLEWSQAEGGERLRGRQFEGIGLRRDGEEFPLEVSVAPYQRGEEVCFTGIVRDITTRKRIEAEIERHAVHLEEEVRLRTQELEAERRRLETVVSASGLGLVLFDRDRTVLWANPRACEWFGVTSMKRGAPCPFSGVEGGPPCGQCPTAVAFQTGRTQETERSMPPSPGSAERSFHVTSSPILDEAGSAFQVVELIQDVTHRRSMEQQLVRAAKMAAIGEISGNVAHEINNPVAVISAKVRLLMEKFGSVLPEKVRKDLEKIGDHSDRIAAITHGLLSFARPTAGIRTKLAVSEVVERSLALAEHRLTSERIQVQRRTGAGLPPVHGDANQLQLVIVNLINNAIDAMEPGGVLTVETGGDLAAGRVWISIADTGRGIDPADLGRIFEPFFSTKAPPKGTGLGLSISLGIVKSHDGELTVRSEPGRGSVFTVSLPAFQASPEAAAQGAGDSGSARPGPGSAAGLSPLARASEEGTSHAARSDPDRR